MVREILKNFSQQIRGLHQAAYLLAALTLASQALALIRDRIFAHTFGVGETLDLYYAAFRLPDIVFALIASLVSAYVLIPRIANLEPKAVRKLLSETASFLLIAGGLLSLIFAAFAPQLLFALFPSFADSAHADEFVMLARLLLIQPILLGLSGIASSVTQTERRFMLFALSPVLYNLGIIVGAVFFYPMFGLPGIGIGIVIGAFAHLLIHLPVLAHAKALPHPVIPSMSVVWSVVRDSVPRSLALGMGSIVTLFLSAIASRTGEGGVSVFALAGNLEAVPLSLVAASYATAAFPVMAEHASASRFDAFKATLTAAARHIIFWSSVITVLVIVLRAHIVRIVLGTGAFDWDATRLTAAVLAILIVGLLAQGLILLAARAFYAAGKSWNPLIVQLGDAGISVLSAVGLLALAQQEPVFRYFVESLFRVDDIPGASVLFVALGATLGQLIMCGVALVTLRSVAPGVARGLSRPVFEGFGAAIVGGAAAYGTLSVIGTIAPLTTLAVVFTEGAVAGIVGLATAFGVLFLLENREFKELLASLKKLRFRAIPVHGPILNDRTNT